MQVDCAPAGAATWASGALNAPATVPLLLKAQLASPLQVPVRLTNSALQWQHVLQQLSQAALQLLFYWAWSKISPLPTSLSSNTPDTLAVVQVLSHWACSTSSWPQLRRVHGHTAYPKAIWLRHCRCCPTGRAPKLAQPPTWLINSCTTSLLPA